MKEDFIVGIVVGIMLSALLVLVIFVLSQEEKKELGPELDWNVKVYSFNNELIEEYEIKSPTSPSVYYSDNTSISAPDVYYTYPIGCRIKIQKIEEEK